MWLSEYNPKVTIGVLMAERIRRTDNTSAQQAQFLRKGFAVLKHLCSSDEVVFLTHAAKAAESAYESLKQERRTHNLTPFRWSDNVLNLVTGSPDRLGLIGATCVAEDLKWISGYVINKPSGAMGLEWHQDWWAWHSDLSHREIPPQVALLIYLGRTGVARGALRVLPGSHRNRLEAHNSLATAHNPVNDSQNVFLSRYHPGEVSLTLESGDAVLLDYRTLHATHPNIDEPERIAIHTSWIPDWAGLPHELKGHLVQHPCLPSELEDVGDNLLMSLMPTFDGRPESVNIDRTPRFPDD
jgi:ectoine hydroxylase-related dioxygenase (phytanoyl-CoA dioxygenase family)